MGKGGESDDVSQAGLVRLLFNLFRGRLLLQFLFVHLWRIAFWTPAPAAFSWTRRALAGGAWFCGTCSHGRRSRASSGARPVCIARTGGESGGPQQQRFAV